jgi:hypothetical protein
MKRILIIACSLMLFYSIVHSQSNNQNDNAEQMILKMAQEHEDAVLKNSTSWIVHNFYEKYFYISPLGAVSNKADVIKMMNSGIMKLESSRIDEKTVNVYGDAGIVTVLSTIKCFIGNQNISGQYRNMYVFAKQNGRWQIVAQTGSYVARQQ